MRTTQFGDFAAKDALMGDGNEAARIWRTMPGCGCTAYRFSRGLHWLHYRAPIENVRVGSRGLACRWECADDGETR